jgi:DnaJ family protein C protein 28
VRASWIRRAVRILTVTKARPTLLSAVSASDLSKLYDHEWEKKERGFHEAAIEDINSLVRKYNGIAPYAVRRPYHNVKGELELCYEKSGEALLDQLKQREQHAAAAREGKFIDEDDEDQHSLGGTAPDINGPTTFWERFTRVLMRWLSSPRPSGTIQQH